MTDGANRFFCSLGCLRIAIMSGNASSLPLRRKSGAYRRLLVLRLWRSVTRSDRLIMFLMGMASLYLMNMTFIVGYVNGV